MARYAHYRCPECREVFRYFHHPSDSPPPDRCELCHAWVSEDEPPDEVFVPQAPLIGGNAYARSVDQTYRAMEAASIDRADEAGAALETAYNGQPRDEWFTPVVQETQREQVAQLKSELKMTNMVDPSSLREGDTSHLGVSASAAAQRLSVGASRPGFASMHTPSGMPAPGAPVLGAVTGHNGWVDGTPANPNPTHNARAAAMVRAGTIGVHRE